MNSCDAILLAAGRGERLAQGQPKAQVRLAGVPLYQHALTALVAHPWIERVVLVGPSEEDERREMEEAARAIAGEKLLRVIPGGAERQDSSRAALDFLHELETPARRAILIHDAARPLLSSALIGRCLAALQSGLPPSEQAAFPGIRGVEAGPAGVIPGLPVRETLKLVFEGRVVMTQPRDRLFAIQTPQVFRFGMLREAHQRARAMEMLGTDDAALLEWLGIPVVVVEGDSENLKVTYPQDLELAEMFLWRRQSRPNTGSGADVFPFKRSPG